MLILTADRGLFTKPGQAPGDSLLRFAQYRRRLARLAVLAPAASADAKPFERDGVEVFPAHGNSSLRRAWSFLAEGRRLVRELEIDLIMTQDPLSGIVAQVIRSGTRAKVCVSVFGLLVDNPFWLAESGWRRAVNPLQRWALCRADLIRTDTRHDRGQIIRRFGVPADRIVALPVPPSPENLARFQQAASGAPAGRGRVVLAIGFLAPQKDFATLLRAFALVAKTRPDARLKLVGDGSQKAMLRALADELGIGERVIWAGVVGYDQLPALYGECALFALSSVYEGLPRELIEASLAARPVVSTAVAGALDIVRDGETGFVVPVRDHERLAEKIGWVLDHPAEAQAMGARGQALVRDYCDFDKNLDLLVAAWRKVVPSTT